MSFSKEKLSPKRRSLITGSAVGAILGVNPWQTPAEAMRRMVREHYRYPSEFKGNIATEWGQNHEQEGINHFTAEFGLLVHKATFQKFGEIFGATPDGLVDPDAIFELKTPFSLRKHDKPFVSIVEQPHYYAQLQFEMRSYSRPKAYFAQYIPAWINTETGEAFGAEMEVEVVPYDENWWEESEPKLRRFYQDFLKEVENPKRHLEPLRDQKSDFIANDLIAEHDELTEKEKHIKARKTEIIDELTKIAGGKNTEFGERKFTLVQRQGSISWQKAFKKFAADVEDEELEEFRGKPSESWRLF